MIEIKNVQVLGLNDSIIRSGYPMTNGEPPEIFVCQLIIKDIKRSKKLGQVPVGTGHDNFLKGVIVQFDLKYPQYFTPQLQRYSWIDIISSQSKMHKLMSNKDLKNSFNSNVWIETIERLEKRIKDYNNSESTFDRQEIFYEVSNNLPMGYNLWMGISTNYLQLKTIYFQRKTHKLPEWKYFCDWIETLPMFKEIVLGDGVCMECEEDAKDEVEDISKKCMIKAYESEFNGY